MRERYAAAHARLWTPANAVPDAGIDLGGRDARAAKKMMLARQIEDNLVLFEDMRRDVRGRKHRGKTSHG